MAGEVVLGHEEGSHDRAEEAILRTAAAYPAAYIAIGRHREGHVPGALLGSVASALVRRADRPLLVVPPGGEGS